jgi:hypothetical protein
MSDIESSCCDVIDGSGLDCNECGQKPRIAQRTRAGLVRFCLPCARIEQNLSHGVSRALVQLLEEERGWAADIAAELFGGSAHRAITVPWVSWDAEREPYRVLPTGFLQVAPDPIGLRWVTSQGKNFGRCGECGLRGPELIGVNVDETRGSATLERTCCRGCAVRLTENAAALRLAMMEVKVAHRVGVERAAYDAQRGDLGFVPIVWLPPMEAVA